MNPKQPSSPDRRQIWRTPLVILLQAAGVFLFVLVFAWLLVQLAAWRAEAVSIDAPTTGGTVWWQQLDSDDKSRRPLTVRESSTVASFAKSELDVPAIPIEPIAQLSKWTPVSYQHSPEPSTAERDPTSSEYLVGVYYFSGWWREQPNKWTIQGRDWRKNWPGRVPTLGEYNEQQTMDDEILAAASHGIDFFQILWYPANGSTPEAWNAAPLNAGLKQFRESPHRQHLKFTIEFVNHPPFDLTDQSSWEAACRVWCGMMKDPQYLRVEGRPVFKIHGLHHFLKQNDGDLLRVKQRVQTLRKIARDVGLPNPLISSGVMAQDAEHLGQLAEPFDFLTTYMDMPQLPQQTEPYSYDVLLQYAQDAWGRYAVKGPKPYVPYLPAGWDPRPWKDPRASYEMPTREQWRQALRAIKGALDRYPQLRIPGSGDRDHKMLLIYAWNEFGEGGIVAPTHGEGAMKLEEIRAIFQ